jgi:hypothetical protein
MLFAISNCRPIAAPLRGYNSLARSYSELSADGDETPRAGTMASSAVGRPPAVRAACPILVPFPKKERAYFLTRSSTTTGICRVVRVW